jgi:hypothetical protein
MKRWLISAAVVTGIIVSAGPAAAAAPTAPPPAPVDSTPFIRTDCGFPVVIQVFGKGKTIDFGDGRLIVPSPGLTATLAANGKGVEYVITGTFHVQVMANGDQQFKGTGRNLLFRPTAPDPTPPNDPGTGLFLTTGNFTFAVDKDGNELSVFAGSGTVVNICDVLA